MGRARASHRHRALKGALSTDRKSRVAGLRPLIVLTPGDQHPPQSGSKDALWLMRG